MKSNNSQHLLMDLIENMKDMIQVFTAVRDKAGEIIDFVWVFNNKSAEALLGKVVGKSLLSTNPGVIKEGIFDTFKKVVNSGEPDDSIRHYVHEQFNGWFYQTTVKQGDGVATTTRDITAETKTQEQVKIHKESLQAMLDGSLHFIQAFNAVRDPQGKIIDFTWIFTNRIWIQHYGDVVGKSLLQENPAVVETGLFEQFVMVTETGVPLFHENYYSHEQFKDQWFQQTLVKLGDGFLMNTEDITERKKREKQTLQLSEDKYSTFFNTIDEGLAVLELTYSKSMSPTGLRWVETNGAFENTIGIQPVPGDICNVFFSADDHMCKIYDDVLKTGEATRFEHYDEARKRWYLIRSSRIGGKGSALLANIIEDITEQKYTEHRQVYLLQLSDVLRSLSDPVEIEKTVTAAALSFFGSNRCYYSTIEQGSAHISSDAYTDELQSLAGTYKVNKFKLYYSVLETGRPFAVSNMRNHEFIDPELASVLKQLKISSFINIPIVKAGNVVGIFSLAQIKPRVWSEWEISLVTETAERSWDAIERAKIEKAIQKSEQQLKMFIAAGMNLAYKMSADWRYMYTLTGNETPIHSAEAMDDWLTRYVPHEDRELILQTVREVTAKKIPLELEHRVFQKDGTIGWLLSRAIPLFDDDGTVIEWLGAGIDITKRKDAELSLRRFNERLENEVLGRTKELKTSRDQLQSILDTTLLQMSVLDAVRGTDGGISHFEIKAINKELERVTGRKDLVGKLYDIEFPGIRTAGIFDIMVTTIETGVPQQMEYYYGHEGFNHWFVCMFVKFNDGVVATNMDVTARKHAEEERFKNYLLLQQSEDIASLGNWDFSLLNQSFTWSEGMYRLFHLEKGVEISPEIYIQYATEKGRDAAERVVRYIRNADSDFEEQVEIMAAGKVKLLHIKAAVVRNAAGNCERVLGVDMDITALYAAEEKIRKMEAQQQLEIFRVSLSTLEEERYRISESLHNGIGQILYGMQLHISGLRQDLPLSKFNDNKSYIKQLLSDTIKETRRISHELMPATLEQFGLKSAIMDICSQLSGSTRFACTVAGTLQGMEKYLELAVYRTTQELMTNVVKHAIATKCDVDVSVGETEIRIRVNDNGQGMDVNAINRKGIGLVSVRSKIKLLNGEVNIVSLPDKGTEINVVIPNPGNYKG